MDAGKDGWTCEYLSTGLASFMMGIWDRNHRRLGREGLYVVLQV